MSGWIRVLHFCVPLDLQVVLVVLGTCLFTVLKILQLQKLIPLRC